MSAPVVAAACRVAGIAMLLMGVAACAEPERGPVERSLVDLVEFAERHDGRQVITEGRVRTFPEPEHYWIEDDALHRVAIEPAAAVSAHVGDRVRVTGRFSYSPTEGRLIRAETVRVIGPDRE